MGPDRHPDSPEDGSRRGPGQDPGRAGENQAGTSALFGAGQRFDAEKAGLPLAAALAAVQAGLESLDPAAARDMARAAAAHPGTRWCLTVTDSLGRAVAHGCARGPRPWVGQAPQEGPRPRDGPAERPGSRTLVTQFLAWLGITLEPIATISCDHHDAEPGYTPSRKLRHKIHARTPTCSYWGCRRPAAQCDDDHTCPWQAGGLTCQCNLAPLCRRHHRMKQRDGWHLEQPEPGVMVWRTPGRRTYITTPADCGS